ncbi:MAG: CatB-related O-acetyltransferase [Chlamydiia bacterium]|nr:CatB-related O-acetyltransferase [Chlamydiia bacterium]
MPLKGPKPNELYPIEGHDKTVFLKNMITKENIHVGDYTYFNDWKNGPSNFEEHNVIYNYDTERVKLVIGKFVAIAAEAKFMLTGDHKLEAFTTYPFPIFGKGWEESFQMADFPVKGDIVVGNDVWIGYDAFIRGGVTIGDGAIVAAKSVVTKDVPPYAIVAGNPARVVKMRFDEETVKRLLDIAWWNWDIEKINRNLKALTQVDLNLLEAAC